jgi:flavin-dependent dehydrogenase
MTTCDVLIVGGGPAGSACAGRLRAGGMDVLVLDRKFFPRDKTCAGWITPQVVQEMQIDLADYRSARTLEPIMAVAVAMMSGRERIIRYNRPISYGIRRCEFDHYLLLKSGARLALGEALTDLKRLDGRWLVNGHIETPLVIGAGGHFCPIARHLGASGKSELAVAAQEIEYELSEEQLTTCAVEPGVPYLYFCDDLKGYGWYYRKGRYLNVGLGREDKDQVSRQVAQFCSMLKASGRIPADTSSKLVGHAYLLFQHSPRRMVDDGALLIGDAAGVAYARSGEGIRPAIESGLMAADCILANRGRTAAAVLRQYEAHLIARFGRKFPRTAADWLPFGLHRALARNLFKSSWFCQHLVVDRWFMNSKQVAYQ